MADCIRFSLFGEENSELHSLIRSQVIVARTHLYLHSFLEETGDALRHAISQLPGPERREIKSFGSIDELNQATHGGHGHTAIQFALSCISQVGEYIRHISSDTPPRSQRNCEVVVGYSIGQLPAAAVALAPTLPTLISLAVEITLIAFRLGLYIRRATQNLEIAQRESLWSFEISDWSEEEARTVLAEARDAQPQTVAKQAYITSVGDTGVAFSGPPSTLAKILNSSRLSQSQVEELSVFGTYHAPHLYQEVDVDLFLSPGKKTGSIFWESRQSVLPLVTSYEDGYFCSNLPATSILSQIINNTLRKPLMASHGEDFCLDQLRSSRESTCTVKICGRSRFQQSLLEALRASTESPIPTQGNSPPDLSPEQSARRTSRKPKLAIVGMAGRFPNAADHEKFWELLEAGLDLHRKVPKDRFDVEKHYDPSGKIRNTSHTPFGCFIDEPGLFDPRFFNMSPREATQTDPMHRLGLVSAYEALEMAGYVPDRTPSTRLDRVGTFYGQTSDDWREINAAQDIDTYFITGGVRAFAPGRINYFFKFTGPSLSIDTACSSSAAALHMACNSLWAGDCDTALVGGLNVMTNSDIFCGLSRGQFLSKTGNCQTYDNDADGYCRGDGIGSIVVKRLEDAEADNDRILAVVLEISTNHSSNAVSITHPHAPTQEILFQKVMDDAGLDAHDVNYVEMHGTGTQAGDGTEMKSVTNVFAPVERSGTRRQSLHIGSVKANAGHGEAVSGVTAMIKCLLMLQKNLIPPHCGIKRIVNQSFPQDLNMRNVHIAFKPTPFLAKEGNPRRIFINNFSAAGGNTATLIEDAPQRADPKNDSRCTWIVAVSAKSKSALDANARNLLEYLHGHKDTRLPDLSYTTTARRIQHHYRIAFSCESLPQATEILASKIGLQVDPVPNALPSAAFAYTGQGSHYTGLGKQLYTLSTQFRRDLTMFNQQCQSLGFPSFLDLLTGGREANDLTPVALQLGLVCIQMALTRLWASWGMKPDVVIGHSLGEYAALEAAGVLSVSDTIYLVGERAKLLQAKCVPGSHAMLATKSTIGVIKETLSNVPEVEVACVNGAQETVLAGRLNDILEASERLTLQGTKCTKLNVQYAFHSSQVDPILEEFQILAEKVTFQKPAIPLISPLLSTVISEQDHINAEYLCRHAREPVNFIGGLAAAQQLGCINDRTVFIEVGPHPVCLGFIKSELGQSTTTVPTLRRNTEPYKTISESLASLHLCGFALDWNEFNRDYVENLRMIDLPAYAFDNKNYWIQYTGDWNLHKGQVIGLAALPEPERPKLSTTTVQKVVSEVVEGAKATIVVESDVSRPDLLAAIRGHIVNGTALCPSSIYADMAITVAEYLYRLLRPETAEVFANACQMEVFKPFIANDDNGKGQTLRLTATADLTTNRASLVFSSGLGKGEVQHAKCCIEYGSGSAWLAEWQRTAYLITGRIESLKQAAASGAAHRMLRGMAYKLFGAFVEYDNKFRGMEEVILDSPQLEATASIVFQTTEADGSFKCSPYWIDSVCHLAGFIVNANDTIDSSKQVYVSHGWESMRFAEPLRSDKAYRSYVKMQPLPGNMVAGDVYIFDGDKIIGMCGALKFQCIPRTLLNTFLPPKGAAATRAVSRTQEKPLRRIDTQAAQASMQKPAAMRKPAASGVTRVLAIIAEEVGMPMTELADPIVFSDIGVDSLMSLSISGRLREELNLDCQSTVFVDHPTVGDFKGFLGRNHSLQLAEPVGEVSESSDSTSSETDDTSSQISDPSTPLSVMSSVGEPTDAESLSMIVRQTISEEMDVDMAELLATEDLSAIGMDSLMALSILGMLREKAGLSLPQDFLVDNNNIKSIEKALHIGNAPTPLKRAKVKTHKAASSEHGEALPVQSSTLVQNPSEPQLLHQTRLPVVKSKRPALPDRQAASVLLQGNSKTATKALFLIPDGSGSPTSYIFLDSISPSLAIWGLTSPFIKTPEEYLCGVVGIATKFITEIKKRQPEGPYHLGGWSAGGVISFETCRQLIAAGDEVETLLLIDTPCPLIIEPLPGSLHKFFGSIGLLGDGEGALERLPPWLLPHFASSVHALATYDPVPLPEGKCPKAWVMWCEDGVCKNPEDPRPDPYPYGHAQWLLENRSDFGPNLWDEFVDGDQLTTRHMPGNHFSMMKAPFVKHLSEFIREAMA